MLAVKQNAVIELELIASQGSKVYVVTGKDFAHNRVRVLVHAESSTEALEKARKEYSAWVKFSSARLQKNPSKKVYYVWRREPFGEWQQLPQPFRTMREAKAEAHKLSRIDGTLSNVEYIKAVGYKVGTVQQHNQNPSEEFQQAAQDERDRLQRDLELVESVATNPKTTRKISRENFNYAKHLASQVQTYGIPLDAIWSSYDSAVTAFNNVGDLTNLSNVIAYGKALKLSDTKIKHDLAIRVNPRRRTRKNESYSEVDFFDDKALDQISAEFQGHISGEEFTATAPDSTPPKLVRLGHLRKLVIQQNDDDAIELNFNDNEDAWLAADRRKNLYFVGADAKMPQGKKPKRGQLHYLGELIQFNYVTEKAHIENGKPTEYYHEVGEVDGVTPSIYADHDNMLIAVGGNYDIWTCGVVN